MFEIFEMPHFQNQTAKGPKIQLFVFEALQIKIQISPHDKIIFHVLFGAFHITFRNHIISPTELTLKPTFKTNDEF